MYSAYNLWRKEFKFWGHGQEKHAAWLAVILHNHAMNTGYTEHSADRLHLFIENEIISVQWAVFFYDDLLRRNEKLQLYTTDSSDFPLSRQNI